MKIFSFNEDSDRLVVVKKSEGEMTVVIKLKNADKKSEKKMNFTPKRLVDVYKLRTRVCLVHIFRVFRACILSVSVCLFLNNEELLSLFFRRFTWARFCQLLDDIDEKVKDLRVGKPVQYRSHVGGGYFVSVTKGYKCVDFRKFYLPEGETEERPTRRGIALRLREWDAMRGIIQSINQSFDSLAKAVPCFEGYDHLNQMAPLACMECYPFIY